MGIGSEHLHGVLGVGHRHRRIAAAIGLIQKAQQQHRQNGADGAQRHQAEAVASGMLIVSDGTDAHAQSHDKRHGHGAGGNAAGVKGDGPEIRGHEHGQGEHHCIKPDEQVRQRDTQQDTQQGDDQENAHAQGNGPDDDIVLNSGHLAGQDLQIRLRHGDDDADEKTDAHDDPHLLGAGDLLTDGLAQGDHGHLRPQRKQAHAHDQQQTADQKRHHRVVGYRGHGEAQQQHDGRDGQHRGQRLPHGLAENRQNLPLLPVLPAQTGLLGQQIRFLA